MGLKKLTCQTVGDLKSGAARVVINDALAAFQADLEQRGHDGKERSVTIKISGVVKDGDVHVNVKAKPTLPEYSTGATVCTLVAPGGRYGADGAILFREEDDRHDQPHLETEEAE